MDAVERRILIEKIWKALDTAFKEGYNAGEKGLPLWDALDSMDAFNIVRDWILKSD
jgi:hypothetical protein